MIRIEIKDGISDSTAIKCVANVIDMGRISQDTKGRKYYCWGTSFLTEEGEVMVYTRQYRKNDCFVVQRPHRNDEEKQVYILKNFKFSATSQK